MFAGRLGVALYWLKTRAQVTWRERRRWRRSEPAKGGPRVFYGLDHLPGRGELSGGGIIKSQDLAAVYPNTPSGANILYLVSSALPPLPGIMIREARRRGVKVVLNQNGVAYPAWHGAGWERTNAVLAEVIHGADHVIYQSAFCKMAADRFLGPCRGSHEILHNPVDTQVFTPPAVEPAADRTVLLTAGTQHQPYRVQVAVDVLARVRAEDPRVRLSVAGRLRWQADERRCREDLDRWARERGVSGAVEVRGPYTQEQAPDLFRGAGILLHTTYNDVCPRLVVEAMACGLPVVYSASGGVGELVGPEAGIGIPAPLDWERLHTPDAAAMAAAVLRIVRSPREYSAAARTQAVSLFDVRPWLERHRLLFEKVLR